MLGRGVSSQTPEATFVGGSPWDGPRQPVARITVGNPRNFAFLTQRDVAHVTATQLGRVFEWGTPLIRIDVRCEVRKARLDQVEGGEMIDPANVAEFEQLGVDQLKARVQNSLYDSEKLKQAREWLDEKAHGEDRKFKAEQLRLQRRADWKGTIAVVVSLVALAVSGGGIYFTNFYRPEDLTLTARVIEREQVGTNRLDVTVVLTNTGKRSVAVSAVLLALNYGPGSTIQTALDWKVQGGIWLGDVKRIPDGAVTKEQDGTYLAVYRTKVVRLNNQDARQAAR